MITTANRAQVRVVMLAVSLQSCIPCPDHGARHLSEFGAGTRRIGEHHPGHITLADVEVSCTQPEQPIDLGTPLDAHNVRRVFRRVINAVGLPPKEWTAREMRHSFVSLRSDSGVAVEDIARLVGHNGTVVTETVYRKQIRPVIAAGATAMDELLPRAKERP